MRLSGRTSASPEQDIVWRDEIGRRVVCSLVFTAAMVAVSAGIHPSDYNAAMWLVTILLRAVPTLILLIVCSMPDKQISPYWPGAVAFMIVAGVASVQLLPLYGLLHPLHVTLPGAVDLSNGHVPWLSYGCSLASPWLISAFSVDYRVSAVSAAVILIVFGALTLHWLGSAKDRAAVILSLIGNAAVLTVSSYYDIRHRQIAVRAKNRVNDVPRSIAVSSTLTSPSSSAQSVANAVTASGNMFIHINAQGTILFVSHSCAQRLGYDAAEMAHLQNESFILQEDVPMVRASLEASFAHPTVPVSIRFRRVDKRGVAVPVWFTGSVSGTTEKTATVLGWEFDDSVTGRRDSSLMSSAMNPNAALNRVVNDNMLVLLSSELKNSLHRLSAVAGSILESDDSLSPETRDDIGLVISATHTTNFHVNDLLTVIKLRDGSLTSVPEPSMLYSCVNDVVAKFDDMLTAVATSGAVAPTQCQLFIRPDVPDCVCWDSPNVQCVLTMLLAAAAKQVSTLGDMGRVAVALAFEPPNFIVLEVFDNGSNVGGLTADRLVLETPGIMKNARAQVLAKVFPVCRQLTDAMLGTISFAELPTGYMKFSVKVPFTRPSTKEATDARVHYSKPGGPTVFFTEPPIELLSSVEHRTESLPAEPLPAAALKASKKKPVVAKGLNGQLLRMHVMLVDDMKPIRRLGESFLEKLGCTSVLLEDGDEIDGALDTSTRPFDAILLDISMNRTDGAQVCQHLRQDLKVHCPIIAMTAKISNVDTQRYYKMGFDLVLPKPFTMDALGRALLEGRDRRIGETGLQRMPARLRDGESADGDEEDGYDGGAGKK